MPTQIAINLPVRDLDRAIAFYTALGFRPDANFTNEQAACMIVSDAIYVMLLVEPFFQTFIDKPISDARQTAEVLLALSCENREEVDERVRLAVAAGARTPVEPKDYGFMYQHGFQDLDGHRWEVFHMQETPA